MHEVNNSNAESASHGNLLIGRTQKGSCYRNSGTLLTCDLFSHGVDAALCLERSIGICEPLQAPQSLSVCPSCFLALNFWRHK